MREYDAIIIGGGFFGLRIAIHLRELGLNHVAVLDKEPTLLSRASYVNQARVHNGYHYPRSLLTAYRSHHNFARFVAEYQAAVVSGFEKYYAIARVLSKVNAHQFSAFCKKIGAPLSPAPAPVEKLFNPQLIEAVYKTEEYAFDAVKLRDELVKRSAAVGGITITTGVTVTKVSPAAKGVAVTNTGETYQAPLVFNCTYSQINALHRASGLTLLPFKHEIAEMCLISLPPELKDFSVTVMDGPFFSIMPFPSTPFHTLSHVRYTPHDSWIDDESTPAERQTPHSYLASLSLKTNFPQMKADITRFLPKLSSVEYQRSIWEVKTVLTKSEDDDSRPILFRSDFGINGYTCIMGGKLDNIYDALEEVTLLVQP